MAYKMGGDPDARGEGRRRGLKCDRFDDISGVGFIGITASPVIINFY